MTREDEMIEAYSAEVSSPAGVSCAAASGYVVPSKPGYYWLRHATPLAGRWQPVMVDTVHGVLGFKKFGWEGWMAISETLHLGIEWGGECLHPHTDQAEPLPPKAVVDDTKNV